MKNSMDKIKLVRTAFWLNGKQLELDLPPGMTTLELLNQKLSMSGTKSSCNEGDCGACTVLIARKRNKKLFYQAVNSCLWPAVRLQGKHLVTVEGISEKDELNPVQTALLDEHGTQCGFCTPGFVMSMLGLFLTNKNPSDEEIKAALEGNLCRCTGYDSIFKAALLLKRRLKKDLELLPAFLRKVEKLLKEDIPAPVSIESNNPEGWETKGYYAPQTWSELWKAVKTCKTKGGFKIIAGGTDLVVLANIQHIHAANLIDLVYLDKLEQIVPERDTLFIGANVSFSDLQKSAIIGRHFSLLKKTIAQMASTQIRNTATLAGNIANASPVADGATTLLALNASVLIASAKGERLVRLCDFYYDYKQTELKPEEIIKAIILPMPKKSNCHCGFIKSAKRKSVDISGVVSAFNVKYNKNIITEAVISFGGVAPYPALAVKTMAFLRNKEINENWFEKAAEIAVSEFNPITDIRGSEQYRRILIKNHILKHLQEFYNNVNAAKGRSR